VTRTQRRKLLRYGAYALAFAILIGVAVTTAAYSTYSWDWDTFFDKGLTRLVAAIPVTLAVAAVSLLVALPLGILVGLCRVARDPVAYGLGTAYVEVIRGTPLLVQLYVWYFVIGDVYGLSEFQAGCAGLSCFTASYIAEIVRGGIQSIDRGQMEAARSLGLSHVQAMIHVILPQTLRRVLPPLASEFIALVKDSSLVSVIGLTELTKATRDVQGRLFLTFEAWLSAAVIYLVINLILSLAVRQLEKKLGQGQRQAVIR
jgi:polar amino acid transport system permease protein